ELPAALEMDGELLGEEALRKVREAHRALDRVVVGERDELHAAPPSALVDLEGIGIALAAQVVEHRNAGATRVPRVHVQIAAHQLHTVAVMATSRSGLRHSTPPSLEARQVAPA